MEFITNNYHRLLRATTDKFVRYAYDGIDWSDRLIAVVGPRGTGKTTMLLQHIKKTFADTNKALYVSLDNIYFTSNRLLDLADRFYAYGGTHLFIDEVHRYPTWAIEIKNIYDSYPDLNIVFTGLSMLQIYKSKVDLSRRMIDYQLAGLSFREFLQLNGKLTVPTLTLKDIIKNHVNIAQEITAKIKILPEFKHYLEYGYYPFFRENLRTYYTRLQHVINTVLDVDLPAVEPIEYPSILKIKKLLVIISGMVPFTPNIATLCSDVDTHRAALVKYFDLLDKAGLIANVNAPGKSMGAMSKPDKVYMDNTNLLHTLRGNAVDTGCMRETFFANQLRAAKHAVGTAKQGDFTIDNNYVFEVGGSSKTFKQIKNVKNSYIAAAETEVGFGNKIPLWLFGLLY